MRKYTSGTDQIKTQTPNTSESELSRNTKSTDGEPKNGMLSNIVKRYMRDPVKTYFGRLKIKVKF